MRALVFANGAMIEWPPLLAVAPESDRIIAADGGAAHCRKWGIRPHVVVGDMDSVSADALAVLEESGVDVVRYPVHKDKTDLWLAIELAAQQGIRNIVVLGALGERWDMTFSNVLMMAAQAFEDLDICLMDGSLEMRCIRGGQAAALDGKIGDGLSLLALSATATGLNLNGLAYPLEEAVLHRGSSHGVSNVFAQPRVEISLRTGCLLITIRRQL